jgi:hypothetical protein
MHTSRLYLSGPRQVDLLQPRLRVGYEQCHLHVRTCSLQRRERRSPVIFVAPLPDLFGMARMFELQGAEARPSLWVVRTAEDAYQILNVEDPQFAPL